MNLWRISICSKPPANVNDCSALTADGMHADLGILQPHRVVLVVHIDSSLEHGSCAMELLLALLEFGVLQPRAHVLALPTNGVLKLLAASRPKPAHARR